MAPFSIVKVQVGGPLLFYQKHPDVQPDLRKADLSRRDLINADLTRADLREANLREANLNVADLSKANLHRANLDGAYVRKADLREANLQEANLRGGIDLRETGLRETNLSKAKLSGADLSRANLRAADLSWADLSWANLNRANLHRTDIRWTNLHGAHLHEVNLNEAEAGDTVFANLDLSSAKGLENVDHFGPSTIGIDTIYYSKGKIPEAFLRGAGVPDTFITYIASLTTEAIQYYSCFISFSHKDEAFAQRLHNDLQGKGVRCWFSSADIKGGRKLYPQIDQAIRVHDKLLLILSEHSIHSEWVMTEIRRARKAEIRDKRRKLFPVRLTDWRTIKAWECFDADTGKDLAVEVREYFIPDFSNWKDHDSYQQAFGRLLKDLKTGGG